MYFDPQDIQKNKIIAAISYLWILFFLPLVACPDSAFGRFHANQALLLLIGGVISNVIRIVPLLGGVVANVLNIILGILTLYGLINTLMGNAKELPVIGHIRILR